jgi:hypothetical protein
MHGTDDVRIVGIEQTVIAFWQFGHDITLKLDASFP